MKKAKKTTRMSKNETDKTFAFKADLYKIEAKL